MYAGVKSQKTVPIIDSLADAVFCGFCENGKREGARV